MTHERRTPLLLLLMVVPLGCDRSGSNDPDVAIPDEPSPPYRNVEEATPYVGDEACTECHEQAAVVYETHAMARSFYRWTPIDRIETTLDEPIRNVPTGFSYSVAEEGDRLYQVEHLVGPDGSILHELRKRMDYVMGSGTVARTYFTEENGRLFQLPLTWYRDEGWDFSPGYEINNGRFDRLMPDRCIACHSSYPDKIPHLEGKYADLPPGIGCERCHGPGALHVDERSTNATADSLPDNSIVNPRNLSFQRRLDVCDQCHVHAPVTVLREGKNDFSFVPAQRLSDQAAFFKATGTIDIVSHADRLRQSACFIGTLQTQRPLECATCHDPHEPTPDLEGHNQSCMECHAPAALMARFSSTASLADHGTAANCVSCHMPAVKERTVPHGTFTDHWIRVVETPTPAPELTSTGPIDPYYERDDAGPDAAVYRGMGQIIYASRAADARLLSEGAELLNQALGADTTRSDALFLLGLAYRLLGRTDDAIDALERSLRINPDRPDRLHALAQEYENANRDADEIARRYEQALQLQPALAWIRADYADFLYTRGRFADAEEAYRAALAERPNLAVASFNLGTLLLGGRRVPAGVSALAAAVQLNPAHAEALESLLQIRTSETSVTEVLLMESPLANLPIRARRPDAVRLTVPSRSREPAVAFSNVPPQASVRVVEPDGRIIRVFDPQALPTVHWDLRTAPGDLIGGGLYHAVVLQRDRSGRATMSQRFAFAIVRPPDE